MTTIQIKQRRIKTFKDVSIQCERIFTLHNNGYGTANMIERCEIIFFSQMKKNGGY